MFEYIVNRIKKAASGPFESNKIVRTNVVNSLTLVKGTNSPKDWLAYKSGNQTNQAMTISFQFESQIEELILKS